MLNAVLLWDLGIFLWAPSTLDLQGYVLSFKTWWRNDTMPSIHFYPIAQWIFAQKTYPGCERSELNSLLCLQEIVTPSSVPLESALLSD